jgi:hypothetical protein
VLQGQSRPGWRGRERLLLSRFLDLQRWDDAELDHNQRPRRCKSSGSAAGPHAWQVSIRAASVTPHSCVRNRRPGDRSTAQRSGRLLGRLVDRKIPRTERDGLPIVTTLTGEILSVAGVAVAEACRVQTPEDSVLLLELRKYQ